MTAAIARDRYDRVAIALHWSIAALLLVAMASGFNADSAGREAHGMLRLHAMAGGLAVVLTLVRITWWLLADSRPDPAPNREGLKGTAAKLVHGLLIVVPVAMAISGVGMLALSGAGAQLFGGGTGPLPDFEALPPRRLHGLGARLLIAMTAVHVGAALYHHYVLRDGLIHRMWPSGRE